MMRTDNATLKARVATVEGMLRAEGLEALVVFANGSALGSTSRMHGYMRYLCNFDGHNNPAMLVLRPGREPTLVSGNNPMLMKVQTRELLWFRDVRLAKAHLLGGEVVAVLGAGAAGDRRRIGYIGRVETPEPVWTALKEGLPGVEWVDFAPRIDRLRVEKDGLQLAFHRRAAEICDAMFETVRREVRSGVKGYQLQAAMEYTARYQGCEYCISWLTVGPRADYPRFYKEECLRVPQEGDQVIPGIYLTYDGHWGHAIRTGTVGKPTDDQRRIYDIVREMQEVGLARLRPGADLFEFTAAMDKVVHKHYRDEDVFRARSGHGLGFSYEDPVVSLAFLNPWDKPLPGVDRIEIRPGMLMEMHPNLYVPGVAGAQLGDMVVVTDTGYEILTQFPRDLIEW